MMKHKSLILSISLLLLFSAQVIMANVFAHNVRFTQPDSDAIFDGNFEDGSGAAIRFVLSDMADTLDIKIMDSSGTVVRTISAGNYSSGDTSVTWDGLDDSSLVVTAGIYKVSIVTSQTGYSDYQVLFDVDSYSIFTRGVTSMKSQSVRNFGFIYALSGGGYVNGVARHGNDGIAWGDTKGAPGLTVESADPIGSDNFRYSAEADNEGNIFAARRSATVPAVYMMNADEQVMRKVDADDWGGQRPQGLAIQGGASSGYLAVANHAGDVYGMALDGSADYFDTQSELILNSNPGSATTDLFFSEYIEGTSNNKALEIYNGTDAEISLDDYQIAQSSNGGGWQFYHTFPPGATIAAGDVWVIITDQMDPLLYAAADADEVLAFPSVVHHNGNDARALIKIGVTDTTFVDVIGIPDSSYAPGDTTLSVPNFDVAGIVGAAANQTLIRKASVYNGNSDWAASAGTNEYDSEWIVKDINTVELGSHTMNVWDPEDNAIFYDVTFGRDNMLYATYYASGNNFTTGVAGFDLSTFDGTPLTLADASWKVEGLDTLTYARTLTYFMADDPVNDKIYFVMGGNASGGAEGVYAIKDITTTPTIELVFLDPTGSLAAFRADVAVDAVGNVIHFENSTEEVTIISPAGGNSYEYVDNFDVMKVFGGEGVESIAAVRIDADSNFVPDRLGEIVTIRGVITSPSIQNLSYLSITIQDETAGITVFSYVDSIFTTVGDLVQVTGEIDHYNGLTEIVVAEKSDIVRLGLGTVPAPIVVSPTVNASPYEIEKLESVLIQINGLVKLEGVWPDSGSSANLTVWDGARSPEGDSLSFTMRIDSDLDMDGKVEPVYPMNVVGFLGQFDSSVPADGGYQLFPRYYTDITQSVAAPPNANFWFTADTRTMDGQTVTVADVAEEFLVAWHPAVDLNGDNLIYQLRPIIDGSPVDINVAGDTSVTLTGQDIIDYVYNAASNTILLTLRTKGAESALVVSVDTIAVTFDITVGVDGMDIIPKEFFVDQNYPNPFNPSTTIQFGLPADAQVNLVIYDILGRKVATLIDNQNMSAGYYQRQFDASKLASGTYIYRLQADQKVEVKKMLLLK